MGGADVPSSGAMAFHRGASSIGPKHDEIYAAFQVFDPDGSGVICREDFVQILTRDGFEGSMPLTRAGAEAIFTYLDTDASGLLTYTELADIWAPPGWRGARFVPLSKLRQHGCIPRRGSRDGFVHRLTGQPNCNLCVSKATFDARKTCFCFVSHRWLRPGNGETGHPDDEQNSKFALILAFCEALCAGAASPVPEDFEVALWIDFACINQDTDPREDLSHLHEIIAGCDIIFTPVVDPGYTRWSYPSQVFSWLRDYQSPPFLDYLQRGWCRVEMMTASVFAIEDPRRARLFRGAMQNALSAGRRPHAIFGTKELQELRSMVFLPPLLNSTFEEFAPEHGSFTVAEDKETVLEMSNRARQMMTELKVGFQDGFPYTGGPGAGRGEFVYADGSRYKGEFRAERKHGRGVFKSASGDTYDGEYKNDTREGIGTFRYADGSCYKGGWKAGSRSGHGIFRYVDGTVYEGAFKAGEKDGQGVSRFTDGAIFAGAYRASKKHGPGTFFYTDGRADVALHKAGVEVGVGVHLSSDRARAWRMADGEIGPEISLQEAQGIAKQLGLGLPAERDQRS